MAVDKKAIGTRFLAEILATLPAELQGKAKEVFEAAEAAPALDVLADGTLRMDDYSKLANDLQEKQIKLDTWHADLTAWFDGKKDALGEVETLRTKVTELEADPLRRGRNADPVIDPKKVVTPEQLEKVMGDTERGAVQFFSALNGISLKHYQAFGEVLDTTQLLTDPRLLKGQLTLDQVYQDVHKDQLVGKATAAAAAAEALIRKDERDRLLKEQAGRQHPYPVTGTEPSTLDAIEAARAGKAPVPASVDDMAAELVRLGAARATT